MGKRRAAIVNAKLLERVTQDAATVVILEGVQEDYDKLWQATVTQMKRWFTGKLLVGACTCDNCKVCKMLQLSNCGLQSERSVSTMNLIRCLDVATLMLPPDYLDPSKNSAYLEYWNKPCNSLKSK